MLLTGTAREKAMIDAYRLHIQGVSKQGIAERLGVSWPTAAKLVDEGIEFFWAERDLSELDAEKRKAIGVFEEVERQAFERLANTPSTSLNVSGLYNVIINARTKICDIVGAWAPKQLKTDNRHEYLDLSKLPDETLRELEAYLEDQWPSN